MPWACLLITHGIRFSRLVICEQAVHPMRFSFILASRAATAAPQPRSCSFPDSDSHRRGLAPRPPPGGVASCAHRVCASASSGR